MREGFVDQSALPHVKAMFRAHRRLLCAWGFFSEAGTSYVEKRLQDCIIRYKTVPYAQGTVGGVNFRAVGLPAEGKGGCRVS